MQRGWVGWVSWGCLCVGIGSVASADTLRLPQGCEEEAGRAGRVPDLVRVVWVGRVRSDLIRDRLCVEGWVLACVVTGRVSWIC